MNSLNKLFFIFSSLSLAYTLNVIDIYKVVQRGIDESVNSKYPWLVVIKDVNEEGFFKLSYGSLIHPKAVLTSARGIVGYTADDLIVETDCQIDREDVRRISNCTSRNISKIMYPTGFDGQTIFDNYYSILILQEAFELNDRINVINLAKNDDEILNRGYSYETDHYVREYNERIRRKNYSCFFTRWMRVVNLANERLVLGVAQYNVSYNRPNFNATAALQDTDWMAERDFIISKHFHESFLKNENLKTSNPLNFMGSPLVCKLKDSQEYVQVGIATFRLTLRKFAESVMIRQEGSLVSITDEIQHLLLVLCD